LIELFITADIAYASGIEKEINLEIKGSDESSSSLDDELRETQNEILNNLIILPTDNPITQVVQEVIRDEIITIPIDERIEGTAIPLS